MLLRSGSSAALAVLASLPYWLPAAGGRAAHADVRRGQRRGGHHRAGPRRSAWTTSAQLYADPAADGRSRGAALSDLFWYWLAPGPHVHQEHLEPGPRYDEVARATRQHPGPPQGRIGGADPPLVAERVLDEIDPPAPPLVRLRDAMMPIWAEVYYELVFGEPCPPEARELIVGNADDVVNALKCTRPAAHAAGAAKLTDVPARRIVAATCRTHCPRAHARGTGVLPAGHVLQHRRRADVRGAWRTCCWSSPSTPDVQDALVAGSGRRAYLDRVIDETLRMYPLFGIAHRITSADIAAGARPCCRPARCCASATPTTTTPGYRPPGPCSTRTAG